MGAIIQHEAAGLALAGKWSDMAQDERKRSAIQACRDRDHGQLCAVLDAHLLLYGASGALVSKHTITSYHGAIKILLREWADVNLLHPTRDQAARLIRELETRYEAKTVAARIAGFRALHEALRWAIEGTAEVAPDVTEARRKDGYSLDPFRDIKPARVTTKDWEKQKLYTEDEIAALLRVAGPLERAFILLGAHAGLRCFEIVGLTWDNVHLTEGYVYVIGKGRKEARQPISKSLKSALQAIQKDEIYVFPYWRNENSARRFLKVVCNRAGVKWRGVHALRHAFGTRVQSQEGDLLKTAELMRHSGTEVTRTYIHLAARHNEQAIADW